MISLRSLRVLIDLSELRQPGADPELERIVIDLIRGMTASANDRVHFVFVVSGRAQDEIARFARPGDRLIDATAATVETAAAQACDAVYCPLGSVRLACPGIPTYTLVADLIHREFPAALSDVGRTDHERRLAEILNVTDRFHVLSEYTAARLEAHYNVVRPVALRTLRPILARSGAEAVDAGLRSGARPYFLYPADYSIQKNHEGLLQAYALYRRSAGGTPWSLMLLGETDMSRLESLQVLIRALKVEEDIEFISVASEQGAFRHYCGAGAVVFPSLHEKFGTPVLEAMALGIPIIASNSGLLPELTGSAALLVDARDPSALAHALRRVADDSRLRTALGQQGRAQAAKYAINQEYGRLLEEFGRAPSLTARWQCSGYYHEDGLVDPPAIFGLPVSGGQLELHLRCRPLPADRTLRIYCGPNLVVERRIAAGQPADIIAPFQAEARTLILRVPDATALSALDRRTHGVLIEQLLIRMPGGRLHDLLAPQRIQPAFNPSTPGAPPVISSAGYLFQLETPLAESSNDGCLELRGWCIRDGEPNPRIRLTLAGMDWPVVVNLPRADLNLAYPKLEGRAHGFSLRLRVPPGNHELTIASGTEAEPGITFVRQPLHVSYFAPLARLWPRSSHHLVAFQLMVGPHHSPRPITFETFPRRTTTTGRRPRFAIATPSFQQVRYLEHTMHSVLDQDVRGEYVVQDGGSTDGSPDLIRKLAAVMPVPGKMQLRSWECAPDGGQTDAIVKGLAKTTGNDDDVMGWINSDDFYLPGALPFVADYFAQHPEVDVLYGNRILVDEQSREIGRWYLPGHDDHVLRLNDFVPQETLFWRRRIWKKVGGLDPSFQFALDWDLLLRFQAAGACFAHVPYFLACFRLHQNQKTVSLFHSVGRAEIDHLHGRSFGRQVSTDDLLNDSRFIQYLRRSSHIEILGVIGLRK